MNRLLDFTNTKISLKRNVADYAKVRMLLSAFLRNKKIFYKPLPVNRDILVDVGCGPNIDHGFYNIDYSWQPGIDRCMDITQGLGLPFNTISGIFTEHCIEHIELEDTLNLFTEMWNVLKMGGVLRIVVPDAELHAKAYIDSLDSGTNTTPFSGVITYCDISTPVMSMNNCMREHGHRFIYDFQTLHEMLLRAGFTEIYKRDYMMGSDSRLLKDSESRKIESLYVEAIKS